MSKTWETLQTAFVDDDEIDIEIKIKNESDIIKQYTDCKTPKVLEAIYEAVDKYNIEQKIDDYKKQIYQIYKNAFEDFMCHESPSHIFDTGLHNNMMVNFIECVYKNSTKGQELEYVLSIQHEYDSKLENERIELEEIRKNALEH